MKLSQQDYDTVFKIIRRQNNHQNDLIFVIEKYIFVRKGREVSINLTKRVDKELLSMFPKLGVQILEALHEAFKMSAEWFESNKNEIT